MYLIFPAFAPVYAKIKHSDIDVLLFSIISSMYNVSRLLLSTTIGALLIKVGKKNFIIIGFAILIVCCCAFAALKRISDEDSDYIFFGAALVINFIQGIGGSILQITGQSIVLQQFGARREVGLAYLSAARGLGFLGGPLLGQVFFNKFDFDGAFLSFAVILTIAVTISAYYLPKTLNANPAKNATASKQPPAK